MDFSMILKRRLDNFEIFYTTPPQDLLSRVILAKYNSRRPSDLVFRSLSLSPFFRILECTSGSRHSRDTNYPLCRLQRRVVSRTLLRKIPYSSVVPAYMQVPRRTATLRAYTRCPGIIGCPFNRNFLDQFGNDVGT